MIEAHDVSVCASARKRIVAATSTSRRSAGELTAIVGPNGSGKTTLLKALSGELAYDGQRPHQRPRHRGAEAVAGWRRCAPCCRRRAALSFPFTVREVVKLGLTGGRSGALAGEAERLPERALARVDLDGFAGRFYQELSGGEQQRVQLARVLCQVWAPVLDGKPRYLFLDEPVSSLDIRHQLMIMDIARDFARRGGGVVAILHDLNLTAMYADQHLRHASGPAGRAGTPQEVLHRRSDRKGVRLPAYASARCRRPTCRSCCRSRWRLRPSRRWTRKAALEGARPLRRSRRCP